MLTKKNEQINLFYKGWIIQYAEQGQRSFPLRRVIRENLKTSIHEPYRGIQNIRGQYFWMQLMLSIFLHRVKEFPGNR